MTLRASLHLLLAMLSMMCGAVERVDAQVIGDGFRVTQNVITADLIAPSVPANIVASGLSESEIVLTWDASTDNVGVTGYQIFRGGVQIATTGAVTTYTDSGLLPATSYDYVLTAFDGAGNVSSSSATTTGTTNAESVETPTTGTGASQRVIPHIRDFTIEVTTVSAYLSWRTTVPTKAIVTWGYSPEYELASLAERTVLSNHRTQIANLQPGTKYYYKIVAVDSLGIERVLKEDHFTTALLPDTEAPPNVRALTGRIEDGDAVLSWHNPAVSDFDRVRVIRNKERYPRDPFDGIVVYEGSGEGYRDREIFTEESVAHYAVFAYDQSGNDSSGAVIRLEQKDRAEVTPPPADTPSDKDVAYAPFRFEDLLFEQDGHQVSYIGGDVPIDSMRPFTITLPYDRLPEHLKTILVTFTHPHDATQTFSFILRVNRDKTAYEATIDALGIEGFYPMSVAILDYRDGKISQVTGTLDVAARSALSEEQEHRFIRALSRINFWYLAFLLSLIVLAVYLTSREHEWRQ